MSQVSAIITTVNRKSVIKAIDSALKQEDITMEVIVVVDGGNPELIKMIKKSFGLNIKLISDEVKHGGNWARNIGISTAKSKYIALLDDDDYWDTTKCRKQLELIEQNGTDNVVVFNSLKTFGGVSQKIYPKISYRPGIPVADYLFDRKYKGMIQTSTLFASKNTFISQPFDEKLPKHQDWDWVIRAYEKGIKFIQITTPLTYYRINQDNSVSKSMNWKYSYYWIQSKRNNMSLRAYHSFIVGLIFTYISCSDATFWGKKKIMIRLYIDNKISIFSKIGQIGILKIILK
ncbi:glycosyltransferase family 2 protein [Lactococcus lactis]|uniref:glycosyltransferase family 2 protein n=1 Tax=Lactococcus lactis TaxID=1358 RepID=UPI003D164712